MLLLLKIVSKDRSLSGEVANQGNGIHCNNVIRWLLLSYTSQVTN